MSNDSLENMRKKMQELEARLTKENPPGSPNANDMVTLEAKAIEWILVAGDYLTSLRSEEFARAKILKLSVKNDDLVRENYALRNQIRDLDSELAAMPMNVGIRNAGKIIGSDSTDSKVISLLNQGKSIREVSRDLGIPYSTVRRIDSEKRSK